MKNTEKMCNDQLTNMCAWGRVCEESSYPCRLFIPALPKCRVI